MVVSPAGWPRSLMPATASELTVNRPVGSWVSSSKLTLIGPLNTYPISRACLRSSPASSVFRVLEYGASLSWSCWERRTVNCVGHQPLVPGHQLGLGVQLALQARGDLDRLHVAFERSCEDGADRSLDLLLEPLEYAHVPPPSIEPRWYPHAGWPPGKPPLLAAVAGGRFAPAPKSDTLAAVAGGRFAPNPTRSPQWPVVASLPPPNPTLLAAVAGGRFAPAPNPPCRRMAGARPNPPVLAFLGWFACRGCGVTIRARVAERQTRWLQVPVSARTWGFKSPLAHQYDPHLGLCGTRGRS